MSHFRADDGEKIHVKIQGDGPPVVFLHGWTSDHREWVRFASEFTHRRATYCWDARGHGGHVLESVTPPTVERMAQDIRCLMAHYDLEDPVLVGHSMGALTVWEYVRQFGCDNIGKLVLIDQSPCLVTRKGWDLGIYGNFPAEENARFIRRLREDLAEALLQLAAYGLNRRAREWYEQNTNGFQRVREQLKKLDPAPLIRCWESLSAADFRPELKKIHVPTLLIYGAQSNFYRVETAYYVRDNIRDSILHVYEGTDHSPHLWERERFVRDLREFIEGSLVGFRRRV